MNLREISRSVFNAVSPSTLYWPKFKAGDLVVPKGIRTAKPVDLPRFEGDTLIHIAVGGFPIKVARLSRGEYSSTAPYAEFIHSRVGKPHYEIEILEAGSAFDNYSKSEIPLASLIHIDAQIFDSRFQKVSYPIVYWAYLPRLF